MDIQNLDNLAVELPSEFDGLPVFVVGGAVRDSIRGVEPTDLDLMVAETTPREMESRGFREIDSPNNDTFAVFQDSLRREVAIAREEVSTGDGHTDFEVEPVPASVEAGEAAHRDLKRRDFTVNAMAFDVRWKTLIDPHKGVADLEEGVIRAVDSTAFREDPLRIVRGARFASRLGFNIDQHTLNQMELMVGNLRDLPNERIRMEMEKALVQSDEPSKFFNWLNSADAELRNTFPEIGDLIGVPAGPEEFHEEGSAFGHTMMVLDEMAARRPNDEIAMLMALAHDLGKGTTPEEDLPSHGGHTKRGVEVVEEMASRLSMSNEQENAMKEAARHHMKMFDMPDLREGTVIDLHQQSDELDRLIDLAHADSEGRIPSKEWSQGEAIRRLGAARSACREWTGERLIEEGYEPEEMGGENFGALLRQRRIEHMRELEA